MTTYRGRSHSSGERALVGIDEAAVMLGEDRSTLYRSIKRGDFPLPVVTINGRMRVRERQSNPNHRALSAALISGDRSELLPQTTSSKSRPTCSAARWSSQ